MTRTALLTILDQTARLLARAAGATIARVALLALAWFVLVIPNVPGAGGPPWVAMAVWMGLYSIGEQVWELIRGKRK